jgi:hypothetical protein
MNGSSVMTPSVAPPHLRHAGAVGPDASGLAAMNDDIASVHALFHGAAEHSGPSDPGSELARLRQVHAALRLIAKGLTATAESLGATPAVGELRFDEPAAFDMAGCDMATICLAVREGRADHATLGEALAIFPVSCVTDAVSFDVLLPLMPQWLADVGGPTFGGAFGLLDETIRSGSANDSLDLRAHRKHWRHIVAALHTVAEALDDEAAAHRLLTVANTITSHVGA